MGGGCPGGGRKKNLESRHQRTINEIRIDQDMHVGTVMTYEGLKIWKHWVLYGQTVRSLCTRLLCAAGFSPAALKLICRNALAKWLRQAVDKDVCEPLRSNYQPIKKAEQMSADSNPYRVCKQSWRPS